MPAQPVAITVTLTGGATFDLVTIPASSSYSLQARTDVDIKITEQSAGTPYFTLKAGSSLDSPRGAATAVALYANGTAGVVVEVLYFPRSPIDLTTL